MQSSFFNTLKLSNSFLTKQNNKRLSRIKTSSKMWLYSRLMYLLSAVMAHTVNASVLSNVETMISTVRRVINGATIRAWWTAALSRWCACKCPARVLQSESGVPALLPIGDAWSQVAARLSALPVALAPQPEIIDAHPMFRCGIFERSTRA